MEPLPNEIYQDIVDFQSDVNRPIDISIYREYIKEAAWSLDLIFLVLIFFESTNLLIGTNFTTLQIYWIRLINLFFELITDCRLERK